MPNRISYIRTKLSSGKKRYYKALKYPEIEPSVNDLYVITTAGDRLDLLADQFYGNVDYWWIIATTNPDIVRRDSFNLKPGLEIRIPADFQGILEEFEQINK
tara:strand:+ start:1768 stop:2073 length:306 start_codon:yes stop_codon:yes gene_type:complete